ncbi:hypothetical protein IGI04_021838 [Brassica rapa subsp. trilocularis]|uniref:Uncharacterized protein n=1 Tax=Brassica rapa subsp. trilocularis TaxID=1813537 RepID=A0ABQ7LZ85_BRACM|nr:hypothetical protein IGI04_021838 [Brassica rapa subsp. trilocularis]
MEFLLALSLYVPYKYEQGLYILRRAEDSNALDLNNLPDDPSRDFFPFFEEGSSSSSPGGFREKQIKDDQKEYQCRFCSLKFFKSQALERETESLNKARELVLRNDTFPPHQGPPSFRRCAYWRPNNTIQTNDVSTKIILPLLSSSPATTTTCATLYVPPPARRPSSFPPRHTNDYYLYNNGTHHQTLTNSGCGGRAPPDSSYSFIGAPVANGSKVDPPISHPLPPHHGI